MGPLTLADHLTLVEIPLFIHGKFPRVICETQGHE